MPDREEPRWRTEVDQAATFTDVARWSVAPVLDMRDPPRTAALVWLNLHLIVTTLFAIAVGLLGGLNLWMALLTLLPFGLLSGLPVRVAIRVLGYGTRADLDATAWSRLPIGNGRRLSAFTISAFGAGELVFMASPSISVLYWSCLAIVIGTRLAALDVWQGPVEARQYIKWVWSPVGALAVVLALVSTAAVFLVMAALVDPLVQPALDYAATSWGFEISRTRSFLTVALAILVLPPPVAAICESIAAVARLEARIVEDELESSIALDRATNRFGLIRHNYLGRLKLEFGDNSSELLWVAQFLNDVELRAGQTRDSLLESLSRYFEAIGLEGKFELSSSMTGVDPEILLYSRFAVECHALNARTHGQASHATVSLAYDHIKEVIHLAYSDDSQVAVDPSAIYSKVDGSLKALKDGIDSLGGHIAATSCHSGLTVTAELPSTPLKRAA